MKGGGATLIVDIADRLQSTISGAGPAIRWAFLIGAWGAVFSSLLGVWQSVPYLFADLCYLMKAGGKHSQDIGMRSRAYQAYLIGIAVVPILGVVAVDFRTAQKTYAVVGALFVPMLAAALLVLNGRANWVGARCKNSTATTIALAGTLLFFVIAGALQIRAKWFG